MNKEILILDDDAIFLQTFEIYLRDISRLEPIGFYTSKEAISHLETCVEPPLGYLASMDLMKERGGDESLFLAAMEKGSVEGFYFTTCRIEKIDHLQIQDPDLLYFLKGNEFEGVSEHFLEIQKKYQSIQSQSPR